jgi:hypothetical protein
MTPAQARALMTADEEGRLCPTITRPISIATARKLHEDGYVVIETWSTWGALRKESSPVAWAATLTERGRERVKVLRALEAPDGPAETLPEPGEAETPDPLLSALSEALRLLKQ